MMLKTKELLNRIRRELKPGSHPGLSRVEAFCEVLRHPEQKLNAIHVAGTNGKGSISNMLRSILSEAGYKTAVFNSPYIASPLEYFQIDGKMISQDAFATLCEPLLAAALELTEPPTEFEFYTVAAMEYFVQKGCDFAIMEAGMGGRLDATNVLPTPKLCVITNIGIDHKEYLGGTIEEIAKEKAGILKSGTAVAVYPSSEEAIRVIRACAKEQGIRTISYASFDKERFFLSGELRYLTQNGHPYQVKLSTAAFFEYRNCATALEAVELLKTGGVVISEKAVCDGLQKFSLPARFEILREMPLIIADGGHNAQCIDAVLECMQPIAAKIRSNHGKVIVLTGMMRDKDYVYVYQRLNEIADEFVIVSAGVSRSLSTEELHSELKKYQKPVWHGKTVKDGARIALSLLSEQDALLISGSFYIMNEIYEALKS